MERKLVKGAVYETHDSKDGWRLNIYREMSVDYIDGTTLSLVIDIIEGPEDYIEEYEWNAMVANTKDENELIESIKQRLDTMLNHKWSSKIVYYYLNDEKIELSNKKELI